MHLRGFKLFLVASCVAVATAAWLMTINLPEQLAVSAIAVAAAVTLLVVTRAGSAEFESEPDTEIEASSAEPDPSGTEVVPRSETESQEPGRPRLRTRGARRLLELQGLLESIGDQLRVQEQTVSDLGDALRRIEAERSASFTQLVQRLDDLEGVNAEQRAALHAANEQRRQHVDRLQHTIAAHKEGLTAIEQMLDAAESPVEVSERLSTTRRAGARGRATGRRL